MTAQPLAYFCFWPLGLTASGYRSLHNKHHTNTGTDHDPELAHKRSRSPQWDLPAKPLKIIKYALSDIVGMSIPDYWIIITYSKADKKKRLHTISALARNLRDRFYVYRFMVGTYSLVCSFSY